MAKVAKLVTISMMTRVVVDDDADDDFIINRSAMNFINKITNEIGEHIEEIVDDEECPYNPEEDDE